PFRPRDVDAGRVNELHQRLDVAYPRHVLERDRVLREERAADDGQRGILVARWTDGAGQAMSALDEKLQCAHAGKYGYVSRANVKPLKVRLMSNALQQIAVIAQALIAVVLLVVVVLAVPALLE